MTDQTKKTPTDVPSILSTVATIVEAVLAGQALSPSADRASTWKAAYRDNMANTQPWFSLGWGRI